MIENAINTDNSQSSSSESCDRTMHGFSEAERLEIWFKLTIEVERIIAEEKAKSDMS